MENSRKIPPHPNVVMFRGVCMDPLCIIVDFCDGGSLRDYLQKESNITDQQRIKFIKEITTGRRHFGV